MHAGCEAEKTDTLPSLTYSESSIKRVFQPASLAAARCVPARGFFSLFSTVPLILPTSPFSFLSILNSSGKSFCSGLFKTSFLPLLQARTAAPLTIASFPRIRFSESHFPLISLYVILFNQNYISFLDMNFSGSLASVELPKVN